MSKLQRQEDEMYEVAYMKSILPDCRICKHHHGQIYGGVELVCAVHPYGYSEDSCPDRDCKKKDTSLPKRELWKLNADQFQSFLIRRMTVVPIFADRPPHF